MGTNTRAAGRMHMDSTWLMLMQKHTSPARTRRNGAALMNTLRPSMCVVRGGRWEGMPSYSSSSFSSRRDSMWFSLACVAG